VVRVNDRGPWVAGRIIDLSYAAAKKIDMIRSGLVKVKVEVIK
jgi:rare lipoprotein A